jgi:glutamyl-tRNA synthetase
MVRTRFAPSPTGLVHVGSLRTALYNYLFAKNNKGTFILRIEDTDRTRYVEGALENLLKTLKWGGLKFDEGPGKDGSYGPYIQSERTEIYRKYLQKLIDKGAAYPCFCTTERLDAMRERQMQLKQAPMYDRTCLKLSAEEIETKKKQGTPFVIRQKIPQGQKLKFKDLIRGVVQFNTDTIDDQVLMKSDNFPTYHLANVIDDHLMEISHVIRGEEWLPSTPKHILLYDAFGWQKPEFAHIPLLLNKDKSKLSKRQGDVSVEDYINKGYLREAIINFISLLGWHPGKGEEKEIFSLEELVEAFSLEKVHKGGAVFDVEKLDWFNFQWQRKLHFQRLDEIAKTLDPACSKTLNRKNEPVYVFSGPGKENEFASARADLLLELCRNQLPPQWLAQKSLLSRALVTVEEKILDKPAEAPKYLEFYFSVKDFPDDLLYNPKMAVDAAVAQKSLAEAHKWLGDFNDYGSITKIQEGLIALAGQLGLKNGQLLWPLRVALSGEQFSPGVFEIIHALGKDESLKRIKIVLEKRFKTAV